MNIRRNKTKHIINNIYTPIYNGFISFRCNIINSGELYTTYKLPIEYNNNHHKMHWSKSLADFYYNQNFDYMEGKTIDKFRNYANKILYLVVLDEFPDDILLFGDSSIKNNKGIIKWNIIE